MSLYLILVIVMAISGSTMMGLSALEKSAFMAGHRKTKDLPRKVSEGELLRSQVLNSMVSTGIVFGVTWLAYDWLYVDQARSVWRMGLEAVGILALYDFGYYLLHRFVLHEWKVGRKWHMVHHRIRTPYAKDSLFIHPTETLLGVGLLMACTWIVGPVSIYSFAMCFFVYSVLNIFIHSAFHLPFFPFRTMSSLVEHHDMHHASMRGGYYASITPIWDMVFGTADKRKRRPAKG